MSENLSALKVIESDVSTSLGLALGTPVEFPLRTTAAKIRELIESVEAEPTDSGSASVSLPPEAPRAITVAGSTK